MKLGSGLFKPIDNAPLIIFRIFLGALLFAETLGAVLTGWVRRVFVEPPFTFSHIGFEWLQPLPGNGMIFYYLAMALLGIMVTIGYRYRLTLGLFTLLWCGVYFMQKEAYNNHYYLLLLVCLIMWFLPANRYASVDAARNPALKQLWMPQWCSWVFVLQLAIVYFYAALSKLTPDWLDGTFIGLLFSQTEHLPALKGLFSEHWFHLFIAWSGMLFDFLIVPMLLWRKTRLIAVVGAFFFHLFNSVSLLIGIFPFFALSFLVFFYKPDRIRKIFFRKKPKLEPPPPQTEGKNILLYFFVPYFVLQLALPLRHHFIEGDVLWTEEGHRLSWRMMLRQRHGFVRYRIVDKKSGESRNYPLRELNGKQLHMASTKPDGVWQMAHRIKQQEADKGKDVAVYVLAQVSVNRSGYHVLVDPEIDLASARWYYFSHNPWVLLYDEDWNPVGHQKDHGEKYY